MIDFAHAVIAYPFVVAFLVWVVHRTTRSRRGGRLRLAALSAVLALALAPSAIAVGHGAWFIGPAWLAAVQHLGHGRSFFILGIAPILASFIVFFLIGVIWAAKKRVTDMLFAVGFWSLMKKPNCQGFVAGKEQ